MATDFSQPYGQNIPRPSDLPQEIGGELPIIEQAEISMAEHQERIMSLPNVVGFGYGEREGAPEKRVLQVFVTQKFPVRALRAQEVVPTSLDGFDVDVIEVGVIVAQFDALRDRMRPLQPGFSIGHPDVTAGTLGAVCYDLQPGSQITPPKHGIGMPARYYVLSNNHVLANSNAARLGDPIIQPGRVDGGQFPRDIVGVLRRYVPIQFEPDVPKEKHNNLVDAAIAEVDPGDVVRKVWWQEAPKSWRPRTFVLPGGIVKKTGRTTAFTTGRIISINATVDVAYGGGKVARFRDQIITTAISAGGDSGSLVSSLDGVAIGLLFAGSATVTICNHIEHVRTLLRVEVAETIQALPSLDIVDLDHLRALLGLPASVPATLAGTLKSPPIGEAVAELEGILKLRTDRGVNG